MKRDKNPACPSCDGYGWFNPTPESSAYEVCGCKEETMASESKSDFGPCRNGHPYVPEYKGGLSVCATCGEPDLVADTDPCAYCDAAITDATVPQASDDDAWTRLAAEHEPGCEWIATRAHQLD